MAEYISKDKFIHFLFKEIAYFEETQTDIEIPISATLQSVVNEIKKFTSEDVQPVKHGRWIYNVAFYKECSECNCVIEDPKFYEIFLDGGQLNYCPNCGAKMREENE